MKSVLIDSSPPRLPTVTPLSTVLSTSFKLPQDAYIVYSHSRCSASPAADTLELARRSILAHNGSKPLLESLLPVIQLKGECSLYVFTITSKDRLEQCRRELGQLSFDGLQFVNTFTFSPTDIYPCSVPCSSRPTRCPSCPTSPEAPSSSSIVCQLPRDPLRVPFALFIQALRVRLLDDIVQTSLSPSMTGILKSVKRFKTGFLFEPALESKNEWTSGWDFNATTRPMMFCHLKIHLSSSRILVHPILRPTQLTSLPTTPSLPSGTPLVLLPYGTSAYFISTYAGSITGLNNQFQASLQGTGAGDWNSPTYLVCYIKVENKNGEEKGLTSIWPHKLCLLRRAGGERLEKLPELPPQLQPSPSLAARQAKTRASSPVTSVVEKSTSFDRPGLASFPSCDSLRAFRTLSLGKERDMREVALEAGVYVDAVAKGREKERERIRKEREGPATNLELALPQAEHTPTAMELRHDSPVVAIFQQQPPPPAPPPSTSGIDSVAYYPSPPQTVGMSTDVPSVQSDTIPSFNISQSWQDSYGFNAADNFDLGLDMDMGVVDMNMGVDLDFGSAPVVEARPTTTITNTTSTYGMSFDDMLTEDDFSFFDSPSKVVVPTFTNQFVAPTPPPPVAMSFSPMWPSYDATVTPASAAAPSPLKVQVTQPYQSPPATPKLVVEEVDIVGSPITRSSAFDAIRFSTKHRLLDNKYLGGKFALPSPPYEEATYEDKTNPKIGIVRKLIGAKRKRVDPFDSDRPSRSLPSPSWEREHEDWISTEDKVEEPPELESENEEDEQEDVFENSPFVSRTSTPQPDYLPLGPTLLHTQFVHGQLLPLSAPLSASSPAAAIGAPTPVSPAAALGANSEKNKALETFGAALAKEAVENSVWADAWGADKSKSADAKLWPGDLDVLAKLMGGLPSATGPLDLSSIYHIESDDLCSFESPKFIVSKGEAIVQVLPTAFRFWDKLGLAPQSGTKSVTAYLLTDRQDEASHQMGVSWLKIMSAIFQEKKLGQVLLGQCSLCSMPGVMPVQFEHFKKSLDMILPSIPPDSGTVVFLVAIPHTIMTPASSVLRQVIASLTRAQRNWSRTFVAHCVQEDLIFGSQVSDPFRTCIHDLCFSLYNKVLKPVAPSMVHRNITLPNPRRLFQAQAFSLARTSQPKVLYLRQSSVPSTNAIDRYTLLHVGYQVSKCRRWLLAACIDQRGEGHDLGVWLMHPDDTSHSQIVSCVWGFASQFAAKASVEWRTAIAKLGSMAPAELEAWITHLAPIATKPVSIISVEQDAPWSIIHTMASDKASAVHSGSNVYVDASSTTVAFETSRRIPLSHTIPSVRDLGSFPVCVLDPMEHLDDVELEVLPLHSTVLIHLPRDGAPSMIHLHMLHTFRTQQDKDTLSDITSNYHDLGVLNKWRKSLKGRSGEEVLPWHLRALERMDMVLVDLIN